MEEVTIVVDSDDDGNEEEEETSTEVEMASPPPTLKTGENSSQTTPGLATNSMQQDAAVHKDTSFEEDHQCPICFEDWTSSGKHRLCSVKCGHLFGRSCIERWLKEPKNKFCPHCKMRAKPSDIRNIFAKKLIALDTCESERIKTELLEEKYKRLTAEEAKNKALLQCQMLNAEMERLKQQQGKETHQTPQTRSASGRIAETLSQSCSMPQPVKSNRSAVTVPNKSFVLQKSFQVATKEARVMAYEETNMLFVVSKPSPNQLFKGYGILKVNSLESRSSEYTSIHQNTIRDAKFNGSGDRLLLTASTDKTMKITSMIDNKVVQSCTCLSPVWSCSWKTNDPNYIYAGLQNGSTSVYDTRKPDVVLASVAPRVCVPVVSLAYVASGGVDGLLVGTLQGGWFLLNEQDVTYTEHPLLLPEGSCSGLFYEPTSRHCLLSQRPSKKSVRVCHSVCSLSSDASYPLQTILKQQCFGGNRAQALTRSSLFAYLDEPDRLLVCAGDEASSAVLLWDGNHGNQLQKIPTTCGTIFDVLSFCAFDSHLLATLSETKLSFYQWR